jgi:coenzyme Q-binding protein COQ10
MAKATKTEIFDAPVSKVYKAIVDYADYPKFVDGMETVDVISSNPNGGKVKFTLNLIKKISYTIDLVHTENKSVTWTLDNGDMMKINNGSWNLKDLGDGRTEVTYSIEVELKGFIPGLGMIEKGLVTTNLPITLNAFNKRAKSL